MGRKALVGVALLGLLLCVGCASIKGGTVAEKQQYVLDMQGDVLKQLYAKQPAARNEIAKRRGHPKGSREEPSHGDDHTELGVRDPAAELSLLLSGDGEKLEHLLQDEVPQAHVS